MNGRNVKPMFSRGSCAIGRDDGPGRFCTAGTTQECADVELSRTPGCKGGEDGTIVIELPDGEEVQKWYQSETVSSR